MPNENVYKKKKTECKQIGCLVTPCMISDAAAFQMKVSMLQDYSSPLSASACESVSTDLYTKFVAYLYKPYLMNLFNHWAAKLFSVF